MTNTITNRQMFFTLVLTLTSFSIMIIAKDMTQSASTGAWVPILITALIFGAAAAVIARLNSMHPGQMLFDYAPSLISRPGAYLLTVYYVLYFMFILVFLVSGFSKLMRVDFFPNTPVWAFPLIGLPVSCFVAYKGVTNVARLSYILGIAYLITAVFIHILMLTEGKVNRILPLFNPADIGRYISAFQYSVFPFLGIEVLLAFPIAQKDKKKSVRTAFLSLIVIGLFYILVIESCVMKLGLHDIVNYKDALIVAIRVMSPKALEIIARMDILYLTVGFGGYFMGISILMLTVVEYLCRMFKNSNRIIVVSAVGAVTYTLFLLVMKIKDFEQTAQTLSTFFGLAGAIVFPLILLVIAKAKTRKRRKNQDAG